MFEKVSPLTGNLCAPVERAGGRWVRFKGVEPLIAALRYIASYAQLSNEPALESVACAALERAGLPYESSMSLEEALAKLGETP